MGYEIYIKFQKKKKGQNSEGIKPQWLGAKGSEERLGRALRFVGQRKYLAWYSNERHVSFDIHPSHRCAAPEADPNQAMECE